jgi:hypothetical protein
VSEASKQIFVRGLSRSGGTLVVTMLDAHPDVAMSYELYEALLDPAEDPGLRPQTVLAWLAKYKRLPRKLLLAMQAHPGLKTFLSRINRGGLSPADFQDLLAAHMAQGRGFDTIVDRLRLIEACSMLKMAREKKKHWGLKCSSKWSDYHAAFAEAYFINVIRDGRDVLASQLNTGSFKTTPEKLGKAWASTHLRFREWRRQPGARGYELFYERLAHEPEREAARLCEFLGIPYDPRMLAFHEGDLTIFKAGHLSMKRISSPIDTKMIGRWRQDLKPEDAEAFCRTAHEAMVEFGYLEGAHAE